MNTINLLNHFITSHQTFSLLILLLWIIIEGEVVLIFAGILTHLGAVTFWQVLYIAIAGSIMKTIIWYYLGIFLSSRRMQNRLFSFIERKINYVLPKFKQKPFWSIFISKFIYGMNHFTLIFSGYSKVNFKTYASAELSSSAIWLTALLSIGYFFSSEAIKISHNFKWFTLLIVAFIIGFVLLQKLASFIYELSEENLNK